MSSKGLVLLIARQGSPGTGPRVPLASESLKNDSIYKVFCNFLSEITVITRFFATFVQKWQYLQGFLTLLFKNDSIYKVLWRCGPEIAILTRFSNNEIWNVKSGIWNLKSEICIIGFWNLKSEMWNRKSEIWILKSEIQNLKSEIWNMVSGFPIPRPQKLGSPSIWIPKSEIWKQKYEIENL